MPLPALPDRRRPSLRPALRRWRALSPTVRGLCALWGLFALLVALRIHGSSLDYLTVYAPDVLGRHPTPTYLLSPLARLLGVEDNTFARGLLEMQPRSVRIDEWGVFTPWALSQLSHEPPFPVLNTNIGDGQNMLLGFNNPVWHPTALARPSTWGYLLLGPERGLAWQWWFQVFAGFTVLYLLLENVLGGERWLAAFGAFWFCGASYAVCWSQWPSYAVFFPCLLCLAAHRLVTDRRRSVIALSGVLLGLGLPGFVMLSYPPWQVPLGWLVLLLLGWLCWRDGAFRRWASGPCWRGELRFRLAVLGLSMLLAVGLLATYVRDTLPAIRAIMGTVYPGSRFHPGGDYGFVWLLRGYYNAWTSFQTPAGFNNQSEAASFLHLFPTVLLALVLSRRIRAGLGSFGWVAVGYLVVALVYCVVGFPAFLAKATLMGRSHPPRVDIALGLVSIMLCVWLLHRFPARPRAPASSETRAAPEPRSAWERAVPWLVALGTAVLTAAHGVAMRAHTGAYPALPVTAVAAVALAGVAYALVAGRRRIFMGLATAAVLATGASFNPLAIGADAVRGSEFVTEVARLDEAAGDRPMWLCYDPPELLSVCGAVLTVAGARSLTGIHQYPHFELWRHLDPERRNELAYNRYAHVELVPCADPSCLEFEPPGANFWEAAGLPPNIVRVKASPRHPALAGLGARFVVAVGALQRDAAFGSLPVRYRSSLGGFTIYDLTPGG